MIGRSQRVMGAVANQFSDAELTLPATFVGDLPSDVQTLQRDRLK